SAWMIGPTAAMALPPQIAVPVVIRNDEFDFTRSPLPKARPTASAKQIPSAVYKNPLLPALITSWRFIPKPSATTDACNKHRDRSGLSAGRGCATVSQNKTPAESAIGGDT